MHDDEEVESLAEAGRLFIPVSETELWTLINLMAAAAGTFDYVTTISIEQGDLEIAETFKARAQLARIFHTRFGKLLVTQHKDTQKH